MPRPRLPMRPVDWKLSIPSDLAGAIEHLIFNRTLGRPRYGARNRIVTALLAAWLRDQRALAETGTRDSAAYKEIPTLEDLIRSPS